MVSPVILICLFRGIDPNVRILWSRSAIFIRMTRTSSDSVSRTLRKYSALFRGVCIEYPRHLRESVDHRGDFGTEDAFHIFYGIFRVFYHIVQQSRDDRFYAQADFVDYDFGDSDGMKQIWFARTTSYAFVGFFGKKKCTFDEVPVFIVTAYLGTRQQQVVPFLLDKGFILGRISHRNPV